MKRLAFLLLLPLLCAWPSINMGGGVSAVAGGCTDYTADASVLGVWLYEEDTTWPSTNNPPDEKGDEDFEDGVGVVVGDLVLNSTSGPTGSKSGTIYLPNLGSDKLGSDSNAGHGAGFWRSSTQEKLTCAWMRVTEDVTAGTGSDVIMYGVNTSDEQSAFTSHNVFSGCTSPDCWAFWDGHNTAYFNDMTLLDTWTHVCWGVGEIGGTNTMYVYENGTEVGTNTNMVAWDDSTASAFYFGDRAGGAARADVDVHEIVLRDLDDGTAGADFEAFACELFKCGVDGQANSTTRAGINDCTAFATP
jgi:hypothetical protein